MAASYPTSVKSFTILSNNDLSDVGQINPAYDEITAVESGLLNGLNHDLKFADATYDIGKSGATRPRDLWLSRNASILGTLGVSGIGTFTARSVHSGGVDLGANGQIQFPATANPSADANTLDDYEEGNWTPAIDAQTPGDLAVTYSTQIGRFTKIGRLVLVTFRIETSSFTHSTGTGDVRITGLPFTSASDAEHPGAGLGRFSGITKAGGYTAFGLNGPNGQTYIDVWGGGSGVGASKVAITDMPSGGNVVLAGSHVYYV